jgi:hypothetical protein
MKFIQWEVIVENTFDCNGGCHLEQKWKKMAIVVVVTHGYHFQLQCQFRLVLVDSFS